jgi:hypothetical protein
MPTLRKIKSAASRHTGQPLAKPKEPFFANAPKTIFSNIKLTLQANFKNRK